MATQTTPGKSAQPVATATPPAVTGHGQSSANLAFLDYYCCPDSVADFRLGEGVSSDKRQGYFQFGPDLVLYGAAGVPCQETPTDVLADALTQVHTDHSTHVLPFNPTEVADNLRYERYVKPAPKTVWKQLAHSAYYLARPFLPVSARRHLQRAWLKGWESRAFPRWPVDRTIDRMFETLMRLRLQASGQSSIPFIWFWPEGKSSCAIVTHDVETEAGLKFSHELMDINDSFGIPSSFQLIPEARYSVTNEIVSAIRDRGFEVNVHDLKHDAKLFADQRGFARSAARINEASVRFGSKGFRSGALYRNLEWYGAFKFSYDMSVPNVGHLDPQSGGCCTVMPYFVGNILELPVTTTQDYSLFHIIDTFSLDLWREQVSLIMQQHGLVSFIVHPDYLETSEARAAYTALLRHLVKLRAEADLWTPLPGEVNTWWRQRSKLKLMPQGGGWRIEGPGAERARVAYATLKEDKLTYRLG